MTIFSIAGPQRVPFYQGKGGRTIRDEDILTFWKHNKRYEKSRGCYIFGIRAGKGHTPGYIGKATKGFKQEIFAHHKLTRYQQFLVQYAKGTPILFFIVAPVQKGKPNLKHIGELEKYLIGLGFTANPDLLNVQDTKAENWGIKGIVRGGQGKVSAGTSGFRKMMGISK